MAQAQTFTAGVDGRLDAVGLHLRSFIPEVDEPLMMAIRRTSGGLPGAESADDLAVAPVGISYVGNSYYAINIGGLINWGDVLRVDLSAFNVSLTKGSSYAIVLYSAAAVPSSGTFSGYAAPYGWDGARTSPDYPGGRAFFAHQDSFGGPFAWQTSASDHDHFFQTFVSPMAIPEPGTFALALAGLVVLVGATLRTNPAGWARARRVILK